VTGSYETNTLKYDESRCSGCGMCAIVCPHGVFALGGGAARVARGRACMECGACQTNCPTGAIEVESGVGCATALFYAALTGKEACCGPRDEPCCGSDHDAQGQAADEPRCCSGPAPREDQ
jgi:NAD-dependent dihydropyrimidine dehydrogenase PreA subunit